MALVTKSFSDIITFTRASTGTFFNSAGVLTSAGNNVPRLDYNPATLAARGLLVEEQRTNLLLQSADFTTTWGTTGVTIVGNVTASPDGGTNGDSLTVNVAGNATNQTSQAFTAGSTITITVFAKKNTSNFLRIELGNLVNCWFDLNTGVTGTNSAGSGNVLFSAKSIQAISNGWYRCVLTVTTTTITTLAVLLFPTNADNTSSSVNSSVFLWGAQSEVGAFPTSYIPTTTTALTRSADLASVNTLSPWYNATEGTLFAQANLISSSYSQGVLVDLGAGGAFGTTEYVNWSGTGWILNPNTPPINVTSTVITTPTAKVAAGLKTNDSVISANGLIGTTDTSCGIVAAPTTLSIGKAGWAAGNFFNGWIQRITYYPRRLSNAELQTITT